MDSAPHENAPETPVKHARVLRTVKPEDLSKMEENETLAEKALNVFVTFMQQAGTPVKPLMSHFTLNRERLLIVFGSPEHVDFRKIVAKLQWDFHTRAEIRHVGVRDEAAVVGGIGSCGRALCCATWIRHFRTINVRMAKAQEISMNPTAINGCCGRLKCCLRYEYDVYAEAGRELPAIGTIVEWDEYEGVVVSRDILRGELFVRTREHGMRHVAANKTRIMTPATIQPPSDEKSDEKEEINEHSSGEWTESGPARQA